MANEQAWAIGSGIAKSNMDRIHKVGRPKDDKPKDDDKPKPIEPVGDLIGSKKKGGKIKKTGRYKLHKGEKEVIGHKVVRRVKRTRPYRLIKGEKIVPAKKKIHRKRA